MVSMVAWVPFHLARLAGLGVEMGLGLDGWCGCSCGYDMIWDSLWTHYGRFLITEHGVSVFCMSFDVGLRGDHERVD